MNIGILAKSQEIMNSAGKQVYDIVKKNGGNCLFFQENFSLNGEKTGEEFFSVCDVAIVLGGDGTLLKIASRASKNNLPLLGINYGRIGLLTDMEKSEIELVENIFTKNYTIDERFMIEAQLIYNGEILDEFVALNDIVISRGTSPKMLEMYMYIDNDLTWDIRADGIIAATPTGSTAYSMSAGGAVVDPTSKLIAITPICPHTLNSRPLIVDGKRELMLKHFDKDGTSYLSCDGKKIYPFNRKYDVRICGAKNKLKLIRIKNRNFYSVLREKL